MANSPKIAIIGLGYVGLPLAVALARHYTVVGFDIDADRVAELRAGRDRTGEVDAAQLGASSLKTSADVADIKGCDLYIVTVPTPIDAANRPDLGPVRSACRAVGGVMATGATVVLESTVYPGVTETICAETLSAASGLSWPADFALGYSPERINPGDTVHTVDKITKVVAGDRPETTALLVAVYGSMNGGDIFQAASIKAAEAAKVIENAQRDINIAFVNEIAMLFHSMGVSIHDVLAAARTKWNFLPFTPGLVGGHCIGVDPYYLAHAAQLEGEHSDVVLAGRRTNDAMGFWIGAQIDRTLRKAMPDGRNGRILVLGLTFKEDVPDLRNTRVVDVIGALSETGHAVDVHDPHADPLEADHEYGLTLVADPKAHAPYDAVVCAVAHKIFTGPQAPGYLALARQGGVIADVKNAWVGERGQYDDRVWWSL
ncbi:MAG: nucleotide sugar dehydrogenase [Pseudomonadota bacterium]